MNKLNLKSILTMITVIIIACLAHSLNARFPLLSAAFYAILFGVLLGPLGIKSYLDPGMIHFIASNFINMAVILLATGLSLSALGGIGLYALPIIVLAVLLAIFGGNALGRKLGLNPNTSMLISAATAICGGSAIMTVAPVIEADEEEIAFGFSTLVLSNLISLSVIPFIGKYFNLSNLAYGILAGIAGKDTAVAVAIGFSYTLEAGEIATIVKLTRTLMLVPLILGLILYHTYTSQRQGNQDNKSLGQTILQSTPKFILVFLAVIAFVTFFPLPAPLVSQLQRLSGFFMTMALTCIGMKADLIGMVKRGLPVIFLGEAIWWLVIGFTLVSLLFIY